MITTRLLRPSLTSRIMASASGFNLLSSTASAPSSASYQQTYTNGANTNTYGSNAPVTSSSSSDFTLTALNRWSVANKQLPSVDGIRALHVYDFDNTLFKTPLPNSALWQSQTIGVLQGQDIFANGGWWHDPSILAATGAGIETEEPRAWEGWWNEKIVELIRLSMRQPDALTVLLTGRSERNFAEIVKRVVASKELEFDMVGLKPAVSPDNLKFTSTMHFKQVFLNAMMETYKHAEEIRIYEDRPKHTKGFREFLAEYNRRQGVSPTRGPLTPEVVQVADQQTTLDPVVEIAQVQTMINGHNDIVAKDGSKKKLSLKKTTFFTSYMLAKQDTEKLLAIANIPGGKNDGIIVQGNNVIISPRPPTQHILDKVGGMGAKMVWKATAIGSWQDKIWAALLAPASPDAQYHVENPKPWVVLAFRKGSKPIDAKHIRQWDPLPDTGFHIETTVGERVVLRIEQEGEEYDNRGQLKRKHADDSDNPRDNPRGYNNSRGGGRGRGRGDRGNRGGGRGRGGRGGRGGFNNYRSLDDVGQSQQGGYNGGGVSYDDSYPPLGPRQGGNGKRGGNGQGGQGRPHGGQASGGQDLQNYY